MPIPTRITLVSYELSRNVSPLLGGARSDSNRVITYYFFRPFLRSLEASYITNINVGNYCSILYFVFFASIQSSLRILVLF